MANIFITAILPTGKEALVALLARRARAPSSDQEGLSMDLRFSSGIVC